MTNYYESLQIAIMTLSEELNVPRCKLNRKLTFLEEEVERLRKLKETTVDIPNEEFKVLMNEKNYTEIIRLHQDDDKFTLEHLDTMYNQCLKEKRMLMYRFPTGEITGSPFNKINRKRISLMIKCVLGNKLRVTTISGSHDI